MHWCVTPRVGSDGGTTARRVRDDSSAHTLDSILAPCTELSGRALEVTAVIPSHRADHQKCGLLGMAGVRSER